MTQIDLKEFIAELEEGRTYLILQLASTFDNDEMHKCSGRLHQLQLMLDKLKQL